MIFFPFWDEYDNPFSPTILARGGDRKIALPQSDIQYRESRPDQGVQYPVRIMKDFPDNIIKGEAAVPWTDMLVSYEKTSRKEAIFFTLQSPLSPPLKTTPRIPRGTTRIWQPRHGRS